MRDLRPFLAAALISGCSSGDSPAAIPILGEARLIDVPAQPGAAQPHVAAGPASLLVSWTEPLADGHALRFASWTPAGWAAPRTVAQGSGWFVNWADFPSLLALSDLDITAHWLQRSGTDRYAYNVMWTRSRDGGTTWTPPRPPHEDSTATEHGFVTLFPWREEPAAVWLDGRQFAGAGASEEMMVRFAAFGEDGAPASGAAVDARACDCCQTDVALTERGPLLTYRDRSPEDVRDVVVSRLGEAGWSEPHRVHEDNWQIQGCPVNGPQIDADGGNVAVAWFTAVNDTPRVALAFSADAGETFSPPIRADGGVPVGRVDVLLVRADLALVVWLERIDGGGSIQARLVRSDGIMGDPVTIGATTAERASGFPRMARLDQSVLVAWTESGDTPNVRAAVLALPTGS